jgi:hypothetical protein
MTDQTNTADAFARHNAQDVMFLVARLSPEMHDIYAAWLQAQTRGMLQKCNEEALFQWFRGMTAEKMEAEHHLLVLEMAWLEYLSREFSSLFKEENP